MHVPYKGGGPALIDVMAGQVPMYFGNMASALPHVKNGKLKALAVTGAKRSSAAPELPTIAESGFSGFNASFAYALLAPAGTPEPIVKLLAREVELAMNTPEVKELNRQADYTATGLNQAQSAAWLADARNRWAEVIRKSNITAD